MILLSSAEHHRIAPLLKPLPMNTYFARAVVEGHVAGSAWVDDPRNPRAGYVAHRYGMSLLFGSPASERFRRGLAQHLLRERRTAEWLQLFPDAWSEVVEETLGTLGTRDTRVNFRFEPSRYARMRASLALPDDCEVIDDVGWIYTNMRGGVVPSAFWDSADDLRRRGAAFAVLYRGELAAAAFASFAMDDALELGIETVDRFRGRGFAVHACSALIDYSLARSLEPVWACRLTNTASYGLANRLGFDPVRSLPYYHLPQV